MNSNITYISLSIIIIAFIAAWIYILILNQKDKIIEKRRWVEQLPSIVSTLGVIGTFLGITLGLTDFDPKDISASIPTLLEGLKTAFFTSLAGMTGSLILSRTISRYHWNSDVIQGKIAGSTINPVCHATSDYNQLLEAAATER